jgi:hypothetical protein
MNHSLQQQVQTVLAGHNLQDCYEATLSALAVCLIHASKDMQGALNAAVKASGDVVECVSENFEYVKEQAATSLDGNGAMQ